MDSGGGDGAGIGGGVIWAGAGIVSGVGEFVLICSPIFAGMVVLVVVGWLEYVWFAFSFFGCKRR